MFSFSKGTRVCDKTGQEYPSKENHRLSSLPKEYGAKIFNFCTEGLIAELDDILRKFSGRVVVFPPVQESREYYYFPFSEIGEDEYDPPNKDFIILKDLLPLPGVKSAKGNPAQFVWCSKDAYYVDYSQGVSVLKQIDHEYLCREMLLEKLRTEILDNGIYFADAQPPKDEDGLWMSFNVIP